MRDLFVRPLRHDAHGDIAVEHADCVGKQPLGPILHADADERAAADAEAVSRGCCEPQGRLIHGIIGDPRGKREG